ncbi:Glutathione S-transferase 2 [Recurvomyces mirabilis]|nr:Glutathione S-transferase 2 [Recurvomyces mirabilis]
MTPQDPKIILYTAGTPNGQKISCTLEELGVRYEVRKIDIAKNEQKEGWFLEINHFNTPLGIDELKAWKANHNPPKTANGRIPALTDNSSGQALHLFEGSTIQNYLCETYDPDHRISFPHNSAEYWEAQSWLTWMQSGLGPMQGQANHFYRYAPEKIQYAVDRYQTETRRLYGVLDARLREQEGKGEGGGLWVVGGKYSIVDLCCFSWVNWAEWAGIDTKPFPALQRWLGIIQQRPAVQRGVDVPEKFEMKEAMRTKEGEEEYAKHHSNWVMQGMKEDREKHQ